MKQLAQNKKAFFDFAIDETLEAGIVLTGQETKSAKTGGMQMAGSYAKIISGQMYLVNARIRPYAYASNLESYDPERTRTLLLHKSEIVKLSTRLQEKGLTLLPLETYVSHGKIKIKLGLGRAKKNIDKRDVIKKREDKRKMDRAVKRIVK